MKIEGTKGKVSFTARTVENLPGVRRGICKTCEGKVVRSHRTGILHSRCFSCRYLVMIYGPSIRVERMP